MMFILISCTTLYADSSATDSDILKTAESKTDLVPPITPTNNTSGQLVNLDVSRLNARIYELERRVQDLERENRFQNDRISNLDRELDDVRRSR